MLKLILSLLFLCVCSTFGYFTLPGKCPENVQLQTEFRLADFFNKWYQVYHYSSDGQQLNNCSVLELSTSSVGIYLNQSRVDRGLFHRYSLGRLEIPTSIEDAAKLDVTFYFKDQPRRLENRRYPFRVLRTDYNNYATVYTCEHSPAIDKHFRWWYVVCPIATLQDGIIQINTLFTVYVWILSRKPVFNVVSKELAIKPLPQIGVDSEKLMKDDLSKCTPKYYEDRKAEPKTFRYPVKIAHW